MARTQEGLQDEHGRDLIDALLTGTAVLCSRTLAGLVQQPVGLLRGEPFIQHLGINLKHLMLYILRQL